MRFKLIETVEAGETPQPNEETVEDNSELDIIDIKKNTNAKFIET